MHDRAQANGRIDILIMENDRLIQSNLKQSSEIESLTSQLNTSLKKGMARDINYL